MKTSTIIFYSNQYGIPQHLTVQILDVWMEEDVLMAVEIQRLFVSVLFLIGESIANMILGFIQELVKM